MNAPQPNSELPCTRRGVVASAASLALLSRIGSTWPNSSPAHAHQKWYEAAASMKHLAESWGDQPYVAVLVLGNKVVGEGPSRVVKNQDDSAHAEREAIRDAQRRLGRKELPGAVLYSTSRPCSSCEAAAAQAKVSRMYFGPSISDAGAPRGAQE
jgi:tRNA(Arg) A34 adenosine deaminase TadA